MAASFGKANVDDLLIEQMSRELKKYRGITVREESALALLKRGKIHTAKTVLDPTFLLTKEEWEAFPSQVGAAKKKYVLVYQLHANKHFERAAKKIHGKEKGLPLIRVSPFFKNILKPGKFRLVTDPQLFLSYIRDAEYVLTDSFHGTVFCLLFRKQFFSFSPGATSTRIECILATFGLNTRFVTDAGTVIGGLPPLHGAMWSPGLPTSPRKHKSTSKDSQKHPKYPKYPAKNSLNGTPSSNSTIRLFKLVRCCALTYFSFVSFSTYAMIFFSNSGLFPA